MPRDVVIRPYAPADRDWLVERHATLYAQHDGFDDTFGPLVGSILDAFTQDHDPSREAGWIAQRQSTRLGSIFCVRHDATRAKLRLFLLVPEARGLGLGARLLSHCTDFARGAGYAGMTLWTHESHHAACALYAKTGWSLEDASAVHSFGQDLIEQTWSLQF